VEFGEVEPDAVEKDPAGGAAADEDGLPPPVVVLLVRGVSFLDFQ